MTVDGITNQINDIRCQMRGLSPKLELYKKLQVESSLLGVVREKLQNGTLHKSLNLDEAKKIVNRLAKVLS